MNAPIHTVADEILLQWQYAVFLQFFYTSSTKLGITIHSTLPLSLTLVWDCHRFASGGKHPGSNCKVSLSHKQHFPYSSHKRIRIGPILVLHRVVVKLSLLRVCTCFSVTHFLTFFRQAANADVNKAGASDSHGALTPQSEIKKKKVHGSTLKSQVREKKGTETSGGQWGEKWRRDIWRTPCVCSTNRINQSKTRLQSQSPKIKQEDNQSCSSPPSQQQSSLVVLDLLSF